MGRRCGLPAVASLVVDLDQAIRRRHMVRTFADRPLPAGALDRLLDLTCRAPSAGNAGGWAVVVMEGPEDTAVFWDMTTTEDWRSRSRRWGGLRSAAAVVVFLSDRDAYLRRYAATDKASSGLDDAERWPIPYWFVDVGMAIMTMLLAATGEAIGAAFLGNFRGEAQLLRALRVPGGLRYAGAVVLGWPEESDPPSTSARLAHRQPDDVVHRGRW